jgi:hypothetical protein
MTAIPSFPSALFAVIALGVFSIASGCKDQEVPRTQSGEPIPFDHLATLPSNHPPIPADTGQGLRDTTPPAPSQPGRPVHSITVTVTLSPALAGKAAPGDTVFIFARAAQGPRMPLAIVRKQVRDLPVTVTLDDSMAMMPNMKMSSFPELVIGARVSKSGDAIPKPGDLEGYAPPLKAGAGGPVEVVIASVVGATAQTQPGRLPADAGHGSNFSHAESGLKSRVNIPPT